MRKVITGEQVAQIYNRDPFALPIWRAPIYETPAAIIALVQLVRLLAWLARLIARHPVAATVAAVMILIWLNIGWLGWSSWWSGPWWCLPPGGSSGRPRSPGGSSARRGAGGGAGGATGAAGPG